VVVVAGRDAREGRDVVGEGRRGAGGERGLDHIGSQQRAGVGVGQLDFPVGEVGGVVAPDDVEALRGVDRGAGGGLEDVDSCAC
jgi:hypothetical protein